MRHSPRVQGSCEESRIIWQSQCRRMAHVLERAPESLWRSRRKDPGAWHRVGLERVLSLLWTGLWQPAGQARRDFFCSCLSIYFLCRVMSQCVPCSICVRVCCLRAFDVWWSYLYDMCCAFGCIPGCLCALRFWGQVSVYLCVPCTGSRTVGSAVLSRADETRWAWVPLGRGMGQVARASACCQRCPQALTPFGHWPCPRQPWLQYLTLAAIGWWPLSLTSSIRHGIFSDFPVFVSWMPADPSTPPASQLSLGQGNPRNE